MSKIKSLKNGYIALMTMIIIGAIILISALSITFISLSQKTIMIDQSQKISSYYLANACANYALIKLQDDAGYGGNETVNVGNYNCQVGQVLGSGNTNRTINTSSAVANHITSIQVVISQIKPKTLIASWQEIY
jgi:hypothetical protein